MSNKNKLKNNSVMATIEQVRAYAATVTNAQTIERYNEFGDIVEVGFKTSDWVYVWFSVFTFMDGRTDCTYMYHYSQRTGKATKRKWDGRNLTHRIEDCTTTYNVVSESKLTSRYSDAYELTVKLVSREIIEVAAEQVNATVNADGLAEVNNATLLKLFGKQVSAQDDYRLHAKVDGNRAMFAVHFFDEFYTVFVIFPDAETAEEPETVETAETAETVGLSLYNPEIEAIIIKIDSKHDISEIEKLILLHDELAFSALMRHQRLNTIESYNDYRVRISERNRLISDYIQGLK